ncbi:MAG: 4-(cytidine 5'-diphospho)-2-C-methyl-D-erythritol kinase [Nitriliruptoraceae bacterium]
MEGTSPSRMRVRVRVPSKINLFLAVRGVREDTLHEVVTVLQTVSIHDTIVAEIDGSPAASHPAARRLMELVFTTDGAGTVPSDDENLAVRAARVLMQAAGVGTAPAGSHDGVPITRMHLQKHIPVAAGLAGGSADAAGALLALNRLWAADLRRDELVELAGSLGADVPFCVVGGTALATGTGTATAQVLTRGTYNWVVGCSPEGLSTADVYRTFDEIGVPSDVEPDVVLHALRTGDVDTLGVALYNDLEVAAFHLRPSLIAARDAMLQSGALGAVVSGSGPTIVGLAASRTEAVRIARDVEGHFDRVELAVSPVGGPELQ